MLLRRGHFPVPRPFVAGLEEAPGSVVGVGPGFDEALYGREVTALTGGGAFAEVVIAPAARTLDAEGLDPCAAAALRRATPTAYDLIHTVTRVRPGDRFLVYAAAGGVGSVAAQFAAPPEPAGSSAWSARSAWSGTPNVPPTPPGSAATR
ncbi:hypothetical protein [Streptomyces racemochromogenes]|uniref:hypothetical protein n=1 Tax=Streptomyces racemochromogenes TaxID=67353 RepID=UPI0035EB6530